jgi:hypothetical protein
MAERTGARGETDQLKPSRQQLWVGVLAAGLAIVAGWLFAAGSVTIGAGDSEGFSRRVDAIVRAADRALAATGWGDPWRFAVWTCGIGTLLLGLVLVWVAAGERDGIAGTVDAGDQGGANLTAVSQSQAALRAATSATPDGPDGAVTRHAGDGTA